MAKLADYGKQIEEVLEASQRLVASGIMTRSYHGNVSVKAPDADVFLLTSGATLADLSPEDIALFDVDGQLLDGTVRRTSAKALVSRR